MRNKILKRLMSTGLVIGFCAMAFSAPALAEDKGIIALQQSVSLLMSQLNDLQKTVTTQTAVLKSLVGENTDTVNKLASAVAAIQQTLNGDEVVASQQQSSVSKQFQSLSDTIAELQARLRSMNDTLQQIHQMQETIPAPATVAQPSPSGAPASGGPSANAADPGSAGDSGAGNAAAAAAPAVDPATQAYQAALTDFKNGKSRALGELAAFIRMYPNNPAIPDAAYYLGTLDLTRQQYSEAIDRFNTVIEQYPDSSKTPLAELDKGIALSNLGSRDAAVSEFRAISRNYPGTEAARRADLELRRLAPPSHRKVAAR